VLDVEGIVKKDKRGRFVAQIIAPFPYNLGRNNSVLSLFAVIRSIPLAASVGLRAFRFGLLVAGIERCKAELRLVVGCPRRGCVGEADRKGVPVRNGC